MEKTRRSIADLLGTDEPAPARKRGRPVEAHRVRLATAQAQLAEIRGAKLRGELVKASEVEEAWAGVIADVRQRFLAIPSRVGAKLALSRETVSALDDEIRAVLSALSAQEPAPDVGSHPLSA